MRDVADSQKSRSASGGPSWNGSYLAPCGFHLFPSHKDHLSGHKVASDDDMKTAVMRWSK